MLNCVERYCCGPGFKSPFKGPTCKVTVFSCGKALREDLLMYVEGTFISMYFPPRKWEGYYALLLKGGREIMPT